MSKTGLKSGGVLLSVEDLFGAGDARAVHAAAAEAAKAGAAKAAAYSSDAKREDSAGENANVYESRRGRSVLSSALVTQQEALAYSSAKPAKKAKAAPKGQGKPVNDNVLLVSFQG